MKRGGEGGRVLVLVTCCAGGGGRSPGGSGRRPGEIILLGDPFLELGFGLGGDCGEGCWKMVEVARVHRALFALEGTAAAHKGELSSFGRVRENWTGVGELDVLLAKDLEDCFPRCSLGAWGDCWGTIRVRAGGAGGGGRRCEARAGCWVARVAGSRASVAFLGRFFGAQVFGVEELVDEWHEVVMAGGHGENCSLQGAADFETLLAGLVKNLGRDRDTGGDCRAVAGFSRFGDETGECRLDVLYNVEGDFTEVTVEFKPLASVEGAEDFFESKDFKPDGGWGGGIESGDGIDEAVEIAQEFVDVGQ